MKRLTTLLGLWAIVINAAMGYSSAMLFCEHETGDFHLVARALYSGADHEESCHNHSSLLPGKLCDEADCEHCIDTNVGGADSQEAVRCSTQDRVAPPSVVTVEQAGFDLAESLKPALLGVFSLSRAPPTVGSVSVLVVKQTVLRI